jgi:hypothetical protein
MELGRNQGSFCRVDLDAAGDSVRTFSQRKKIVGYPIGIHARVGICG